MGSSLYRRVCFFSVISYVFFFSSRRRHTRWPRDWSSDVCSSDLADSRAEMVLAALGLAGLGPGTRLTEISGGQRERLALAHLLIGRPTTWLLDEPTNHLDDQGAAFLTGAITSHPGPVLIASHDRAFLHEATRAQLDLDPAEAPLARPVGGVTAYTGGFSDYLLARFEAR